MDGESWQTNLESWRERRRAAAKALALEIQQHCDASPQSRAVTKDHILYPNNDTQDNMQKLKTPDRDILKMGPQCASQCDVCSGIGNFVSSAPSLPSDRKQSFSFHTEPKQASPPSRPDVKTVQSDDMVILHQAAIVVEPES
ncbi:unnamed protein product [Hydatigera taeniaeformis]|uniref:DUF4757 domain-containing protein n=1 Tax=Hydatigena taeniaeformis TaxID=6205 RepID=A0A0R3WHT4_HYDTA|nr:unnamed protein product [Hydatigera taeniaeformis]